ncbi:MAG: type I DNA topoisomerase [Phycisphaerae bacterium]
MAKKSAKSRSARALVIVESPAKAKTINKYLGSDYIVKASRGHVRDLPKRRYGIDPGRNFEPSYELLPSHQKIIDELRKAAKGVDEVFLATDLDREGEAIAWHLMQALELSPEKTRRVVFNEITKSAIQQAFEHPLELDQHKVNAQQARRILDRIVGYELSPLLWKKVAKGLSAGRVQSVAVRIIVDRESEIRAFQPQEYWTVEAVFSVKPGAAATLGKEWKEFTAESAAGNGGPTAKDRAAWLSSHSCFVAELIEMDGKAFKPAGVIQFGKAGDAVFESAVEEVRRAAEALGVNIADTRIDDWNEYARLGLKKITLVGRLDAAPPFTIRGVDTKRTRSRPPGPFTTASLQQAASTQMRFNTTRTMRIAQQLYEGIDLGNGEGPVGLITYMRTDSTHLSKDSVAAARGLIGDRFGANYVPDKPNVYSSAKGAQAAHEAVRPTDPTRMPQQLKGHLSEEQQKLYSLIWKRFVACQMKPAEWDATTARIEAKTPAGTAVFKANGRVLVFDGFYKVAGLPRGDEPILPALETGAAVAPITVDPQQKFTQPPPRFTEASLVKGLESEGIGRPSTYAAIIDTIQKRGYVKQDDRRFQPTHRGEIVTQKLVDHFPKIMDTKFTSYMESQLDKIEEAHLDWHAVLHEFYEPFREALGQAHEGMEAVRAQPSEYTCEQCKLPMVYRLGPHGRFLSCSGFPKCKAALDVDDDGKPLRPADINIKCDACGRPMQMRRSRNGSFLGCTGYPECTTTMPCDDQGNALKKIKPEDLKEECPECGSAMRVNFFRGRSFLGCSSYPTCKATKDLPEGVYVEKPKPEQAGVNCEKCGRPMVIRKSRRGPFLSCSGFPKCRNAVPLSKLDELKAAEAAGGGAPKPSADDGDGDTKVGKSPGKKAASTTKSRKAAPKTKAAAAAKANPSDEALPEGISRGRTGKIVVEKLSGPIACLSCGSEMTIKPGRWGPFLSCSNFPRCRETGRLKGDALKKAEEQVGKPEPKAKPIPTDVDCPECGAKMLLRMGRTGRFLGCSTYPKCKKAMEPPPGLLREIGASSAAEPAKAK